jgi:hypothetical protein
MDDSLPEPLFVDAVLSRMNDVCIGQPMTMLVVHASCLARRFYFKPISSGWRHKRGSVCFSAASLGKHKACFSWFALICAASELFITFPVQHASFSLSNLSIGFSCTLTSYLTVTIGEFKLNILIVGFLLPALGSLTVQHRTLVYNCKYREGSQTINPWIYR